MNRTTFFVAAATCTIMCVACVKSWRARSPEPLRSTTVDVASKSVPGKGSQSPLGQPLITTDELLLGASVDTTKKGVSLNYVERIPGGTDSEHWTAYFGTTYEVTAVAARQSNEILVAGMSTSGECVLERWTNGEPDGSHFLHITPATTSIGTTAPSIPPIQAGVIGGQHVSQTGRPQGFRQHRDELYRGVLGGAILSVAADPEKRFVTFLCESPRRVYQLANSSSVPTLVADELSIPELVSSEGSFLISQHDSDGRLYFLTAEPAIGVGGGPLWIRFSDVDNDGVFDGSLVWPHQQFLAAGSQPAWLRPDFLDFSGD